MTIESNLSETGQVAVHGTNCESFPCQVSLPAGKEMELIASTTDNDISFFRWEWINEESGGTESSTDNPMTIVVDEPGTIKAVFKIGLVFPIDGYNPYNAPISSVFDHSGTAQYSDTDNRVVTFTGEIGNQDNYPGTTCYNNSTESAFGSGFNYDGISGAGSCYLCYNGHPGYDYAMESGTVIRSANSGTITASGYDSCLGNNVTIEKRGIYRTRYFHLDSIDINNVQVGQAIQAGVKIGELGNTGSCSEGAHLHFQVEKKIEENWIPVDPYGWTGTGSDPYTRATNINLWQ